MRTDPFSLDEVLAIWLPRRIDAIHEMSSVLNLCEKFGYETPVDISIADMPAMNRSLSTYAEPIISIGYLHARALLEFMGLGARKGKLVQLAKRQASDIAIEHYSIYGESLSMISLDEVYAAINMPQPVVEWSLVNIIETANKLVSHVTTGEVLAMAMYQQVRIGLESIPMLLNDHLYAKLELTQQKPKQDCGRYACKSNG